MTSRSATNARKRGVRIDFSVPTGSDRSLCRYCAAAIYWVRGYRGPLHAATAIEVDGDRRMESHVPYCPSKREALAAVRRTTCSVRGCARLIKAEGLFCRPCWELLPQSIREWLFRTRSGRLTRPREWEEALDHARKLAEQLRRPQGQPARLETPDLFAHDDQGDH